MTGISSPRSSALLVVRHVDVVGQRRPAEDPQVDVGHHVPGDALRLRHPPRGVQFDAVPLPVPEAQRVRHVALRAGDRQHRGRVQSAAQQHHRRLACHHALLHPSRLARRPPWYHNSRAVAATIAAVSGGPFAAKLHRCDSTTGTDPEVGGLRRVTPWKMRNGVMAGVGRPTGVCATVALFLAELLDSGVPAATLG